MQCKQPTATTTAQDLVVVGTFLIRARARQCMFRGNKYKEKHKSEVRRLTTTSAAVPMEQENPHTLHAWL